jgi:hypothetical protein
MLSTRPWFALQDEREVTQISCPIGDLIEAQIKPTFIAHGMEEGVSPARFLYEGGKLKDECGFSGLVWHLRRHFSASGDITSAAGPAAYGVGRD